MKNIVKIFLIIAVVLLILVIISISRNLFIFKSIYDVNSKLIDTLGENYCYTKTTIVNGNDELSSRKELFYKDGIYLENVYLNNEKINIYYFNTNTDDKKYLYAIDDRKFAVGQTNINEKLFKRYSFEIGYPEGDVKAYKVQFLKHSLTSTIKIQNNKYVIRLNNGSILTVDKDTKIIKSNQCNDTIITYEYKQNIVTDKDITLFE